VEAKKAVEAEAADAARAAAAAAAAAASAAAVPSDDMLGMSGMGGGLSGGDFGGGMFGDVDSGAGGRPASNSITDSFADLDMFGSGSTRESSRSLGMAPISAAPLSFDSSVPPSVLATAPPQRPLPTVAASAPVPTRRQPPLTRQPAVDMSFIDESSQRAARTLDMAGTSMSSSLAERKQNDAALLQAMTDRLDDASDRYERTREEQEVGFFGALSLTKDETLDFFL
jgi:hypothetical protein